MKQISFFIILVLAVLHTNAQLDSAKRKIVAKEKPSTLVTDNPRYIKAQPMAQLPDLAFSAFNVSNVSNQVVGGVTKYTLEISYTVKNMGNVAVAEDKILLQGFIGYPQNFPGTTAGCGRVLSASATDIIKPGETRQDSFRCTVSLDRNNHPFYTLQLDYENGVKELNEQNNSAQMTILF
jgi:hypothetical protein